VINIIPHNGAVRKDDDLDDRLLTGREVAALFRVDAQTVGRWARSGRLSSLRTPGGQRRYRESEVRAMVAGVAA
jgi:excisionase family DNA binding protein